MKVLFKISFILIFLLISFLLLNIILKPVFLSNTIIIPYSLNEFNICEKNPLLWEYLKIFYIIFYLLSSLILSSFLFNLIFKNVSFKKKNLIKSSITRELRLNLGKDDANKDIYIDSSGLYQNFLITGTTGSGKTTSAIYPITKQLLEFDKKIGMLILDVKGNFSKQVKSFCADCNRLDDLYTLEINGSFKYNPLDKPLMPALTLANRLKTILTLFSENNSDSYWLDKVEQIFCESIKLCRLYNDNYVTFLEIHKLITDKTYYIEKTSVLKKSFQSNSFSSIQHHDLLTAISFFENEFYNLDQKVLSILRSEVTRITTLFISDINVLNTFCPNKQETSAFKGFDYIIKYNKILVMNINIINYKNLSKVIAAYLKLDFQDEVLLNLNNNTICTTAFICDEFHEYVTATDANFFSLSREAKCINIVATQSYSSLLNTIKNEYTTKVIIQNLINKLWFRTDDLYTIEDAQKQIGKEDKEKVSKNISESSNFVQYNFLINSLKSNTSNFSEGTSTYIQTDYVYDTNFFTHSLKTFEALAFLSNGYEIIYSSKLYLTPFFK